MLTSRTDWRVATLTSRQNAAVRHLLPHVGRVAAAWRNGRVEEPAVIEWSGDRLAVQKLVTEGVIRPEARPRIAAGVGNVVLGIGIAAPARSIPPHLRAAPDGPSAGILPLGLAPPALGVVALACRQQKNKS
jgi:hypothetical protein